MSQTFGAGINKNETRVYKGFADSIIDKKDIVLKSNGSTIINYVYTVDAIIGLLFILLNGKSLDEYIYNRIEYDKRFYIINKSFWDKWEELISDPVTNMKELENLNVCYDEISREKMLNEGLVYLKDYIILLSFLIV